MSKKTSTKSPLERAVAELFAAKTLDALEEVWNRYADSETIVGSDAGIFSAAYDKRQKEIAEQELTRRETEKATSVDRRAVWEKRIGEFMAAIGEQRQAIDDTKQALKDLKKKEAALRSDLDEILRDGPENFVLDATPLLTLAEGAEQ